MKNVANRLQSKITKTAWKKCIPFIRNSYLKIPQKGNEKTSRELIGINTVFNFDSYTSRIIFKAAIKYVVDKSLSACVKCNEPLNGAYAPTNMLSL